MFKGAVLIILLAFVFKSFPVLGEQPTEKISKPNFDQTFIHKEFPSIYFVEGSSLIRWEDKNRIVSEIVIQFNKIATMLGSDILSKYVDSEEVINVAVVSHDDLDQLVGSFGANAVTIDGVIYLTPSNIASHIIRHEVMHAAVYVNAKNKVPWWIEEGLAQILSGELEEVSSTVLKTNIERKYQDARLRVMKLINKCGFRSFGEYLTLISEENTERYAFNKVFNEVCYNGAE